MYELGYIKTDYCNIATVELEKKSNARVGTAFQ